MQVLSALMDPGYPEIGTFSCRGCSTAVIVAHSLFTSQISGLIEQCKHTSCSARWRFQVTQPGAFEVWVVSGTASAHDDWHNAHHMSLQVGGQQLSGELTPDKDLRSERPYYFPERATLTGRVCLAEIRRFTLTMTADKINHRASDGLCIAEIRLEPITQQ